MASNPLAPNDRTPLLQIDEATRDDTSDTSHSKVDGRHSSEAQSIGTPTVVDRPLFPLVPILCGLLSILADLGGGLTSTPEVRLLELAVCREYYIQRDPAVIGPPPGSYVDEALCKLDDIQANLAYLRAWKSTLMTIPGILFHSIHLPLYGSSSLILPWCTFTGIFLTLPFGRLADKWGRKPVMILGLGGQISAYLWVLVVCE